MEEPAIKEIPTNKIKCSGANDPRCGLFEGFSRFEIYESPPCDVENGLDKCPIYKKNESRR